MNKISKILLSLFFASLMFLNGCDELNNLPLNIPSEPIYFSSTGQNNFSFDDGTFCLSQSEEWRDNVNDIESVSFVEASFWSDAGTTPGLTGDIKLTVREGSANGTEIFTWNYEGLVAAAHQDSALAITLTEEEKSKMNSYLENFDTLGDLCFYGSLETSNITGQGPPFTVNAHVIFVIEAIVETSN